jgi:peptide/nickel transport system ATP-binding protein
MNKTIVRFEKVSIEYLLKNQHLKAVNEVTLDIPEGKITAFVGESGSGKTTLVSSLLQTISSPGKVTGGAVYFYDGDKKIDVTKLNEKEINQFRWEKVSMVFQASQSTLNPLMTIYDQFYETAYYHNAITTKEAFDEQLTKLFSMVKLDKSRVLKAYPHQLSGGMKQRIMIVFALLLNPKLIILDEPTTALDVITQEYIFNQLLEINHQLGITMILLTHDIGAVAKIADYVAVMYAGSIMEYGDVYTIFKDKDHPYTAGLIGATPSFLVDSSNITPIAGRQPDIRNLPKGCPFYERCQKHLPQCEETRASLCQIGEDHLIQCHLFTGGSHEHS